MTAITLVIAVIIGLPLGILLVLTRSGGQAENKFTYTLLNWVINILRSLPFIILLFFNSAIYKTRRWHYNWR